MKPLHLSSSFRPTSMAGTLAWGLGLALLAPVAGCSSDDVAATPVGGAGSASTGTAGAGGEATEAGGGMAGAGSGTDAGALCARPQMASDIGDHCVVDGGTVKNPATTCPTGGASAADGGEEVYPMNHSGTSSDDDNCKYDVSYGIVPCDHGGLTTLNVNLKSRATGMPMTGADPHIEALVDNHPLGNPEPKTTELGNGDYKIEGVHFDKDGFWTVRFHFFETCSETAPASKHSHIAFTVIVE